MRGISIAAFAALLAACTPPETGNPMAENGCPASASSTWRTAGGGDFAVEATAEGANCTDSEASIVIRDRAGRELWREEYPAAQVMVLAGAASTEEMHARLMDWIDVERAASTTAQLPEWPEGERPMSGEFEFYPDEGLTRELYESLRTQALPSFCYVQGMESLACLYFENGALQRVGVQSFPG